MGELHRMIAGDLEGLDTYLKAYLYKQFYNKDKVPTAVPIGSKLDLLPHKVAELKAKFLSKIRVNEHL